MEVMPLECPVQCPSGRCSTSCFASNEEFAGGWRLCWHGTSVHGLYGPPAVAGVLSWWPQHCPHLVAPLHRTREGPKPHLEPPRPGGALPGRSPSWFPYSHTERCSQIWAGFFNETICLAFLTQLGLVGPFISSVPILVCLSPPAWPSHPAQL